LLETSDQFRDSLRSNTGDRTILGRITKRGSGLSRWQGREGHESPIEQRELKAMRVRSGQQQPHVNGGDHHRPSPLHSVSGPQHCVVLGRTYARRCGVRGIDPAAYL